MCFRGNHRRLGIFAATLGALLGALSACSLHEKPPTQKALLISPGKLGCLTGSGQKLDDYLQGNWTDKDTEVATISGVWDCASVALQTFTEKVKGSKTGAYTPDELREFLQKYFVKDTKISQELQSNAMVLKTVLVGGSVSELTFDEITAAQKLLHVLKEQSLRMLPYLPLKPDQIGKSKMENVNPDTLRSATRALEEVAYEIGGVLQAVKTPYSFSQMDSLMQSAKDFPALKPDQPDQVSITQRLHDHLGFLQQLKSDFIRPGAEQISYGYDWAEVMTEGARWYGLYLDLSHFFSQKPLPSIESGAGLAEFSELFHQSKLLLAEAVERQPEHTLTFEQIDALIDRLYSSDDQKKSNITAATLKHTFRRVVLTFLAGSDQSTSGRNANGLTTAALNRLESSFEHWHQGQRILETIYARIGQRQGGEDPGHIGYIAETILGTDNPAVASLWDDITEQRDSQWGEIAAEAGKRLQKLIRTTRPLFEGDDTEIKFTFANDGLRYSFHDLSEVNWMRELARLMIAGYADPARADAEFSRGVSFSEFNQVYLDLRPLGIEIKYFDPTDIKTALSRFREANLFAFSANGDAYISLDEATQELAFLISSKRRSNRVHAEIAEICHADPKDLDPFDFPWIDAKCYRSEYFKRYAHYWDRMPGLVSHYSRLDPRGKRAFMQAYEMSARKLGAPADRFGINDSDGFSLVAQYVEALFTRFDRDNSGSLGPKEADAAFPIFRRTLQKVAYCRGLDLNDSELKLVFTYLLKTGKVPTTWEGAGWEIKRWLGFGSFAADRSKILDIFAQLSAPAAGPQSAKALARQSELACQEP